MALPDSYRLQSTCWNCKHAKWVTDYDCEPELFCNVKGDAPPCTDGASGRDDIPMPGLSDDAGMAAWDKIQDAWRKWAFEHAVAYHGICNQHEHRPQSEDK